MICIDDVLISKEVVKKHFICDLSRCKGACCWKGDFGAPLEVDEINQIEADFEQISDYLTEEGLQKIKEQGFHQYYDKMSAEGTTLLEDESCVFMNYDQNGIAQCGIEQAHKEGKTDLKKPISCHLYPIRVKENKENGFKAMNYDVWDICKAACTLGEKEQVPLYQFVKDAIVRKYGVAFYEELDAAASYLHDNQGVKSK